MPVGNDVVDLGDPQIAGHHLRPRFLARVLCEEERVRVVNAADPRRLLWSLFAAKEAAYKIVAQRAAVAPVFAHRRFRVAPALDAVDSGDELFALRVGTDDDVVHAVASTAGCTPVVGLARVAPGADASAAARALLCAALAPVLGCAADELQVVRAPRPGSWDGQGPPRLYRRGVALAVQISLSHDGRWVGFAADLGRRA